MKSPCSCDPEYRDKPHACSWYTRMTAAERAAMRDGSPAAIAPERVQEIEGRSPPSEPAP